MSVGRADAWNRVFELMAAYLKGAYPLYSRLYGVKKVLDDEGQ